MGDEVSGLEERAGRELTERGIGEAGISTEERGGVSERAGGPAVTNVLLGEPERTGEAVPEILLGDPERIGETVPGYLFGDPERAGEAVPTVQGLDRPLSSTPGTGLEVTDGGFLPIELVPSSIYQGHDLNLSSMPAVHLETVESEIVSA